MKQGLDVKHINPFLQSSISILENAAQIKATISKPSIASLDFGSEIFALQVGLTGDLKGQIFIVMTEENAKFIASKMMCGMPVEQLDEISSSALCELSNMIMGNTSTIFSTQNIHIDITPPISLFGTKIMIQSDISALKIPFLSEGKELLSIYLCVTAD